MSDADFIRLALQAARQGVEKGEMPFGACLVSRGQVVAIAHNSAKSGMDTTAHAEIQAIREAGRKIKSLELPTATMYSTCEPCPMCFAACVWAKITRIVYASRIEDADKAGIRQIHIPSSLMNQLSRSNVDVVADVLREEGVKLFEGWRRKQMKSGV
ncbi:MAG: nucleoside deaminase [Nitrospira sp.]|jgi:tRNA(Arg) A34 adenosine deaminase TadA|nr:nucleoside deaminase [Nitrospira sp. BO4]